MRSQFQEILALVRAGKPAERSFEAEGTAYVRIFIPGSALSRWAAAMSPRRYANILPTWALP